MLSPTLISPRLMLSQIIQSDIDGQYPQWLNDHDVARFLQSVSHLQTSTEDVKRYVESCANSNNDYLWAIRLRSRDSFLHVGTLRLTFDENLRSAEVGYMIGDKAHWGKGLAGEAVRTVMLWAFNIKAVERLWASVHPENVSSKRVLEKLDFRKQSSAEHFGTLSNGLEMEIWAHFSHENLDPGKNLSNESAEG